MKGKWRITKMPDYTPDYPDMVEPAYILFDGQGGGEFAFGCVTGQIWGAGDTEKVAFSWAGNNEMDEASGNGWADLLPNGNLKGQICFHSGDEADFTAKPASLLQQPAKGGMMSEHNISLTWAGTGAPFTYETYSRDHQIAFKDGAQKLGVSASPHYKGDGSKPDPEDLLVAALSSCHMLSFLAVAAKKKLTVSSYEDEAVGFLENEGGKLWITRVILRPKVAIQADAATLGEIHHLAHQACFIANSVKTDVQVEPR